MNRKVFIGLGSNLGDRFEEMNAACQLLVAAGCNLICSSAVYETAPWGLVDQPAFLNAVIQFEFDGSPEAMLEIAMEAEKELGRRRLQHWGPRKIDIDILAMAELEITSQRLTVPHPMLAQRAFVLLPWAEIAPDFVVVKLQKSVATLLSELPDSESEGVVKTDLKLWPDLKG